MDNTTRKLKEHSGWQGRVENLESGLGVFEGFNVWAAREKYLGTTNTNLHVVSTVELKAYFKTLLGFFTTMSNEDR